MFKWLFKLNAILLFLLGGYFVNADHRPAHSANSSRKKHTSFTSTKTHIPAEQLINATGIPVQLSNSQRNKTVHYFQLITEKSNESVTYICYLAFICGRSSSELSLFRKLTLFPFHVFW